MAIKPGVLCTLEKDKLIDTQQGFVDTFNWVVASVNNLKGGQNCEVSWPAPDTPQIDSAASESEGGGGGGGDGGAVQFTGTTGTTDEDTSFTFSKQSNSNVTITCSGTDIKIGVYYI